MRKVVYYTEENEYHARSLSELRKHISFFNGQRGHNPYNDDYIHRFIRVRGSWIYDDNFLLKIRVVNGRVVLRRV